MFIDGKQVGIIAHGETKDFPCTAGPHIVIAKMDWCSSQEISIDLKENEIKELKVGGFKYGQWLMPIAVGLIILNAILSKFFNFEYLIYLLGVIFLLFVYYATIGREKYLILVAFND